MRILITSASLPLPRELAEFLSQSHKVCLTDRNELESDLGSVRSDLSHDHSVNELVRGMDAIVHSGEVNSEASASEHLDFQMRCTYNLLKAAFEEGVSRFVYLSSLKIMGKYSEDLMVTEQWRPVPSTDMNVLGCYLGEYVCREFGREGRIDVVCLRLGDLVDEAKSGVPLSSSALFMDDAVLAVEKALVADLDKTRGIIFTQGSHLLELTKWNAFQIQSDVPNARYSYAKAQDMLGYIPISRTREKI